MESVIKALISPFIDLVITGFGPVGPHLLSTVVLLLLDHIHSSEKHAPSHFTSINVILWELTGVLIGMKNCIQTTCLRGNDNTRSLTKQSCKCLPVDGILHLNVSLSFTRFPAYLLVKPCAVNVEKKTWAQILKERL